MTLSILNNYGFMMGGLILLFIAIIYYVVIYALSGDKPHNDDTSVMDRLSDVWLENGELFWDGKFEKKRSFRVAFNKNLYDESIVIVSLVNGEIEFKVEKGQIEIIDFLIEKEHEKSPKLDITSKPKEPINIESRELLIKTTELNIANKKHYINHLKALKGVDNDILAHEAYLKSLEEKLSNLKADFSNES